MQCQMYTHGCVCVCVALVFFTVFVFFLATKQEILGRIGNFCFYQLWVIAKVERTTYQLLSNRTQSSPVSRSDEVIQVV